MFAILKNESSSICVINKFTAELPKGGKEIIKKKVLKVAITVINVSMLTHKTTIKIK